MLFCWLIGVILSCNVAFGEEKNRRVIRQAGSIKCTTANNTVGLCINIKNCPPLFDLLQNRAKESKVVAYLRKSHCGTENGYPKVCCVGAEGSLLESTTTPPQSTPNHETIDQTTRSIYSLSERSSASNICTTPNSKVGWCISLKSCPSLLNLLQTQGRDHAVKEHLRKSRCGTENNTPKVCCPKAEEPDKGTFKNYSQCGESDKKAPRLNGNPTALPGDWPWMVALGYRTSTNPGPLFKCGGSLISNYWVITAANCVSDIGNLTLTTVRIGDLELDDFTNDGAKFTDVPVDQIIPHPKYSNFPIIINDIALVRLRNPVTFTKLVRPICIPSEAEFQSDGFYSRKLPFIIGWGPTDWRGPTTNSLQEAQIEIINNLDCVRAHSEEKSIWIDQRVICAGSDGKHTCLGDSGAQLIIPVSYTYYLVGVSSFGIRCAHSNVPGVFTKVAHFADWIKRTAQL